MARISRKCSVYFFSSQKHTWRPISCHSSLTVSSIPNFQTALQPVWPPCCSWNLPDMLLPQGLCTCLSFSLECSFPNIQSLPTSCKSLFKSIFSMRPALTIPYKITSLAYPLTLRCFFPYHYQLLTYQTIHLFIIHCLLSSSP